MKHRALLLVNHHARQAQKRLPEVKRLLEELGLKKSSNVTSTKLT
jgi:hypothetical protein